jgi:GSH-dependent disulfide-bond oxidoreductase
MTLFGMSSPNVRKVVIALHEMALSYALEHVAVFKGQQFDLDVVAINPLAKVPILIDPDGPAAGEPIFESGAILLYLAEHYGPEFLPASGAHRYVVLKWLFLQAASMGPALGNHSHFRTIAEDNSYAAGRFRRMAAQTYRALDARLAQAPYLGGGAYSIADMATYPWARYFRRHGMRDADCPHLIEWMERIGRRSAVLAAGKVIDAEGARDAADRAEATPEQIAMFTGSHVAAPTVEEAAAGTPTSERRLRRS